MLGRVVIAILTLRTLCFMYSRVRVPTCVRACVRACVCVCVCVCVVGRMVFADTSFRFVTFFL